MSENGGTQHLLTLPVEQEPAFKVPLEQSNSPVAIPEAVRRVANALCRATVQQTSFRDRVKVALDAADPEVGGEDRLLALQSHVLGELGESWCQLLRVLRWVEANPLTVGTIYSDLEGSATVIDGADLDHHQRRELVTAAAVAVGAVVVMQVYTAAQFWTQVGQEDPRDGPKTVEEKCPPKDAIDPIVHTTPGHRRIMFARLRPRSETCDAPELTPAQQRQLGDLARIALLNANSYVASEGGRNQLTADEVGYIMRLVGVALARIGEPPTHYTTASRRRQALDALVNLAEALDEVIADHPNQRHLLRARAEVALARTLIAARTLAARNVALARQALSAASTAARLARRPPGRNGYVLSADQVRAIEDAILATMERLPFVTVNAARYWQVIHELEQIASDLRLRILEYNGQASETRNLQSLGMVRNAVDRVEEAMGLIQSVSHVTLEFPDSP